MRTASRLRPGAARVAARHDSLARDPGASGSGGMSGSGTGSGSGSGTPDAGGEDSGSPTDAGGSCLAPGVNDQGHVGSCCSGSTTDAGACGCIANGGTDKGGAASCCTDNAKNGLCVCRPLGDTVGPGADGAAFFCCSQAVNGNGRLHLGGLERLAKTERGIAACHRQERERETRPRRRCSPRPRAARAPLDRARRTRPLGRGSSRSCSRPT